MFDYFASIDWTQTWSTVLVGVSVVFAVLLILVAICWVMGKIFSTIGKNGGNKTEKKSETKPAVKAAAPAVKAAAPVVEDGITDEVVAAISAAIACMMGEGKAFAVKSIRRAENRGVRTARSAWSAAGIAENTRPF